MDKPFWTVRKLADLLEAFALTHQYAFIDSVRIMHDQKRVVIMLRDTSNSEPHTRLFGPEGKVDE